MDIDDTMDYAKVKCAVLQKFEIRDMVFPSNSAKLEPRNKVLLACHSCGETGHFKAECPKVHVSKNYMCFQFCSPVTGQ